MRFDQNRIADGQASIDSGQAVPGREGGASNDQTHTFAHRFPGFVQFDGDFAHAFDPIGLFGVACLFLPGHGKAFQSTVGGMGAGGLKGHHVRLPGGVHGRMGNFYKMLAQAHQTFDQEGATQLGTGLNPRGSCLLGFGHEGFVRKHRIANAQAALQIGRYFFAFEAQRLILQ